MIFPLESARPAHGDPMFEDLVLLAVQARGLVKEKAGEIRKYQLTRRSHAVHAIQSWPSEVSQHTATVLIDEIGWQLAYSIPVHF